MSVDWRAGNVFLLDYDTRGHSVPEMVKQRMVVIVNSRSLRRPADLVTVVPLSTSGPDDPGPGTRHVVPLSQDYPWGPHDGRPLWAKCDMIDTVATQRLVPLRWHARHKGENRVPNPSLSKSDLRLVRLGCAHTLALDDVLTKSARKELGDYLKRARAKLAAVSRIFARRRKAKPANDVEGKSPPT